MLPWDDGVSSCKILSNTGAGDDTGLCAMHSHSSLQPAVGAAAVAPSARRCRTLCRQSPARAFVAAARPGAAVQPGSLRASLPPAGPPPGAQRKAGFPEEHRCRRALPAAQATPLFARQADDTCNHYPDAPGVPAEGLAARTENAIDSVQTGLIGSRVLFRSPSG